MTNATFGRPNALEQSATRVLNIAVAGVPYGCQDADSDGYWLQDRHRADIAGAAQGAAVTHLSRADIEAGRLPESPAEVLLIETSGADPGADIIPGILHGDHVRRLVTPSLRWVQSASVGIELVRGLFPPEVIVTNARGVHSRALAESIFAGILFHTKRLAERKKLQERSVWEWAQLPVRELTGSALTMVGTGHIGQQVARRAKAFDMRVVGVRRSGASDDNFDRVVTPANLREVLGDTHFLVLACPLTPETEGMIDAEALSLLPAGAFVVNVGRGRVLDEQALIASLESGHLGGAYLDVVSQEPLPSDSPLWTMPNVMLVPHDSHASQYIGDNNIALFADNLRRYLRGLPLRNLVDFDHGY